MPTASSVPLQSCSVGGKKKGVKQLSFAEDHGNERPPRSKEGGLSVHFRCSGDRVRAAALAQLCRLLVTSDYPVT